MDTLKALQDLIQEKFDIDPATLDPHASMLDHGLDSLALVEFLFEIEDRFQVAVPDQDKGVNTLAGLADLIDRLQVKRAA